ncbi:Sec63-domain-containing protein [Ramicandelaber brevisporus]|nr:Sec63-domain-containing protein [Ramicandelaber brevisporus]
MTTSPNARRLRISDLFEREVVSSAPSYTGKGKGYSNWSAMAELSLSCDHADLVSGQTGSCSSRKGGLAAKLERLVVDPSVPIVDQLTDALSIQKQQLDLLRYEVEQQLVQLGIDPELADSIELPSATTTTVALPVPVSGSFAIPGGILDAIRTANDGDSVSADMASVQSAPEVHDSAWLDARCQQYLNSSSAASATASMSATELRNGIISVIRDCKDDSNALEEGLINMLGYDDLEFVMALIAHSAELIDALDSAAAPPPLPPPPPYSSQSGSNNGNSSAEASLGDAFGGMTAQELRAARNRALHDASVSAATNIKPSAASSAERYPNVYTSSGDEGGGNMLSSFGTRYALPVGSTREDLPFYEEIIIPTAKRAPVRATESTRNVAGLDPLCRFTFKGYSSLNRIQSIVYPVAYETNENMLISAPTGAGKTDTALLTILRTISTYCSPSPSELRDYSGSEPPQFKLATGEFKIVYVAPMKALAAEVTAKFSAKLQWLGVAVRELTGDMQLTRAEIARTQVIVTTPEKWDVVTRKGAGDAELVAKVRLIIVDEVHLLHEERGAVVESIIARTLRQVESTQSMIRIVGISATLPNYVDVAAFLRVNPYIGMFYFDSGFRPIPLEQHFVGVKGKRNSTQQQLNLDRATYEKVELLIDGDHQVMVFVHSRKGTAKAALSLTQMARDEGRGDSLFRANTEHPRYDAYQREVSKARTKELHHLFPLGIGLHHAGMPRSDRMLVEKLFAEGILRVLCCTATLAWGVNLPAYAVVIKGTDVYDAQKGAVDDLSVLDVQQIFGRAGRPQFESHGVGYILTPHDRLAHYLALMTEQHPIESRFERRLVDCLNAEVCLGTVTNVDEAVQWLGYTYLFVRMRRNPLMYGMGHGDAAADPSLGQKRYNMVVTAARALHKLQMVVFHEETGSIRPKDLGRIASAYYLRHDSIETFNTMMRATMGEADVLSMVALSAEFENMTLRETESKELEALLEQSCFCDIRGGAESVNGKVNILLQAYLSRAQVEDFGLVSDSAYVAQNAGRLMRALFEVALNRRWGPVASVLLGLTLALDKRMWPFEHPLSQMGLPADIVRKLSPDGQADSSLPLDELRTMNDSDLGRLVRNNRYGNTLRRAAEQFPSVNLSATIAPITRTVLRIHLTVEPNFVWNDRVHGGAEPWWIWVEDGEHIEILHSEYVVLTKRSIHEPTELMITIPVHEPLPAQIFVRAVSDKWVGAESLVALSFQHLLLPAHDTIHTELLDLQPLPVSALKDPLLESYCSSRFTHFNPVQTQIFHTLYHTDHNVLLGAATGSGKTVAAELAMWWAFRTQPPGAQKVVYIAPLKALVRERVTDWGSRLAPHLGRRLVELTGDVTPDAAAIARADIIITTPEKWDGISRAWQSRGFVRQVALVIIDEIHLLGADRGPILEVLVSRLGFIAAHTTRKVRVVGLSTALANAHDVADWLQVPPIALFNFRHSIRPVPVQTHIEGFAGKHYCPRMASMNRPAYRAIKTHSPSKPVIVFVSSRRQTRLTAQDLIALCAAEDNPRQWLAIDDLELEAIVAGIRDPALALALGFGIGLHHAGLSDPDRRTVEALFAARKIQVLIATSTLAWGVNLPAHLVIVKGTEFFDAKTRGYVDMPLTDVLQMIGRAGRPQFDDTAIACIFVAEAKREFYRKFLHEPFPVESSLHLHLADHLNAETATGAIKTMQDAADYLAWTYLMRRIRMNPTYYGALDGSSHSVNEYVSGLLRDAFKELELSRCALVDRQTNDVSVTPLGRITSQYYLSHRTMRTFAMRLPRLARNATQASVTQGDTAAAAAAAADRGGDDDAALIEACTDFLKLLSDADEYSELPVRHHEDLMNRDLESLLPVSVAPRAYDSPHAKTLLLLAAHLTRAPLPIADYATDTRSVLDQAIRVLQAMIDVCALGSTAEASSDGQAGAGRLSAIRAIIRVIQHVKQGIWFDEDPIAMLPGFAGNTTLQQAAAQEISKMSPAKQHSSMRSLVSLPPQKLNSVLERIVNSSVATSTSGRGSLKLSAVASAVRRFPQAKVTAEYTENSSKNAAQIRVNIVRSNGVPAWTGSSDGGDVSASSVAYCPAFGRPQDEGWFVAVTAKDSDELVALRRVVFSASDDNKSPNASASKDSLAVFVKVPADAQNLQVHVISDVYCGIDPEPLSVSSR